jgi:hypothetical protein
MLHLNHNIGAASMTLPPGRLWHPHRPLVAPPSIAHPTETAPIKRACLGTTELRASNAQKTPPAPQAAPPATAAIHIGQPQAPTPKRKPRLRLAPGITALSMTQLRSRLTTASKRDIRRVNTNRANNQSTLTAHWPTLIPPSLPIRLTVRSTVPPQPNSLHICGWKSDPNYRIRHNNPPPLGLPIRRCPQLPPPYSPSYGRCVPCIPNGSRQPPRGAHPAHSPGPQRMFLPNGGHGGRLSPTAPRGRSSLGNPGRPTPEPSGRRDPHGGPRSSTGLPNDPGSYPGQLGPIARHTEDPCGRTQTP